MDFGHALEALKDGGRVKRPEWGTQPYLQLRQDSARPTKIMLSGGCVAATHWYPTHDDLLAEDWVRIDAEDAPVRRHQEPAPDPVGQARDISTCNANAAGAVNISVTLHTALMSDDDINRLVTKIGRRIGNAVSSQPGHREQR